MEKDFDQNFRKSNSRTFILKMQIIHGAGYISEKFKDHYVSSSYTSLLLGQK